MDLELDSDVPSVTTKPTSRARRRPKWRGSSSRSLIFVLVCAVGLLRHADSGPSAAPARPPDAPNARATSARSSWHCTITTTTYGSFPPAYIADANGRPMHSWRVLILPFMEQQSLYAQYDFSRALGWSEQHQVAQQHAQSIFACPSRFSRESDQPDQLRGDDRPRYDVPGPSSTKFADITDGTSNTLMIVEVANVNIPGRRPDRPRHAHDEHPGQRPEAAGHLEQAPGRGQRRLRRRDARDSCYDGHPGQSAGPDHHRRRRGDHG